MFCWFAGVHAKYHFLVVPKNNGGGGGGGL